MAAAVPSVMTQLIAGVRPGWLFTVPLPAPVVPPEILIRNGPLRNRASTARLAVMVALQVPVPEHKPNQRWNECPAFGVAVRVTTTPLANCCLHPVAAAVPAVTLQLMPDGLEVTVPSPDPLPVTVKVLVTRAPVCSTSVSSVESWQA